MMSSPRNGTHQRCARAPPPACTSRLVRFLGIGALEESGRSAGAVGQRRTREPVRQRRGIGERTNRDRRFAPGLSSDARETAPLAGKARMVLDANDAVPVFALGTRAVIGNETVRRAGDSACQGEAEILVVLRRGDGDARRQEKAGPEPATDHGSTTIRRRDAIVNTRIPRRSYAGFDGYPDDTPLMRADRRRS
jgi:hypothetical protein